jgi:hypothetical protein
LNSQRLEARTGEFTGRRDGDIICFEWNRPVQELACVVANLEKISSRAEHRMLAKLVSDFREDSDEIRFSMKVCTPRTRSSRASRQLRDTDWPAS